MNVFLAVFCGVALLVVLLQDAFEVMLLPRRISRRWRLSGIYFRRGWNVWSWVARLSPEGAGRERFLAIFGPLSLTLLFAFWATGLIAAFGLLQWAAQQSGGLKPASPVSEQVYLSGVTFFTLGYGDVVPKTAWSRILAVVEAGMGFGFIAIVIGYLPVLYQLFSRREAHVIQLDGRAGSPPTAATMLRRHAESDGLDKLDDLLRSWEIWGAELLESHLSYPMLAYYRSQHDDQSWLASLAAIMDICTLILIGVEDVKPLQARMTFAMLRQVVVEIARSLRVSAVRTIDHDRMVPEDVPKLISLLEEVGLVWNGGLGAAETLNAVRGTYEPLLVGLSAYLLIPLPGWFAVDESPDHWEKGPRGIIARRLISGLAAGTLAPDAQIRQRRGWGLRAPPK